MHRTKNPTDCIRKLITVCDMKTTGKSNESVYTLFAEMEQSSTKLNIYAQQ